MDDVAAEVRGPVGVISVLSAVSHDAKLGMLMRAQHRGAAPFHSPRDLRELTVLHTDVARHHCGVVAIRSDQACKALHVAWREGVSADRLDWASGLPDATGPLNKRPNRRWLPCQCHLRLSKSWQVTRLATPAAAHHSTRRQSCRTAKSFGTS